MPKTKSTTFYSLHLPVIALGLLIAFVVATGSFLREVPTVVAGETHIEEGSVFENTMQEGNKKAVMRKEYRDGKIYITIKTYDLDGNLLRETETVRDVPGNVVVVDKDSDTEKTAKESAKTYFKEDASEDDTKYLNEIDSLLPSQDDGGDDATSDDLEALVEELPEDIAVEIEAAHPTRKVVTHSVPVKMRSTNRIVEEEGKFFIETETNLVDLTTTPDKVVRETISSEKLDSVDEISVDVNGDSVKYTLTGTKIEKLFGLFSTTIPAEYEYDVESNLLKTSQKDLRTMLIDLLSF